MERKKLKAWARNAFFRSYWKGVLVSLVYYAITFFTIFMMSYGLSLLLAYVLPSCINILVFDDAWNRGFVTDMVIFMIVLFLCIGTAMMIIGVGVKTFVGNNLEMGCKKFFSKNLYYQRARLGEMGAGFSSGYRNVAWTLFVRDLYLGLWSLLSMAVYMLVGTAVLYCGVIIVGNPGENISEIGFFFWTMFLVLLVVAICIASFVPFYIKVLHYLFIPYILAENPHMSRKQVFDLSKQMIEGEKWNVCVMHLSFSGWLILSGLTSYILHIFYVGPYIEYTTAAYYEALKQKMERPAMNYYGN